MPQQTEYLRLGRIGQESEKSKLKPRHTGILQDQLRRYVLLLPYIPYIEEHRAQRRPWTPSFSGAVRLLLLMRVAGAMYSNISDCDEGRLRHWLSYARSPMSLRYSFQLLGTPSLL